MQDHAINSSVDGYRNTLDVLRTSLPSYIFSKSFGSCDDPFVYRHGTVRLED